MLLTLGAKAIPATDEAMNIAAINDNMMAILENFMWLPFFLYGIGHTVSFRPLPPTLQKVLDLSD